MLKSLSPIEKLYYSQAMFYCDENNQQYEITTFVNQVEEKIGDWLLYQRALTKRFDINKAIFPAPRWCQSIEKHYSCQSA